MDGGGDAGLFGDSARAAAGVRAVSGQRADGVGPLIVDF